VTWFELAKIGVCFGNFCSKLRGIEMDFHGMKRKRLQALCKKHDIPANLKNSEMADRLSLLFKVHIIVPFSSRSIFF